MVVQWLPAEDNQEVFERPLGEREYIFYLDSRFKRTADVICRIKFQADAKLLTQERLNQALWYCRSRLPLLGASILYNRTQTTGEARFRVSSNDVKNDFVRLSQGSKAADELLCRLLGPEPELDDQHQSRCFVVLDPSSSSCEAFFLLAHAIADGISSLLFARHFLHALSQNLSISKLDLAPVPSMEWMTKNRYSIVQA